MLQFCKLYVNGVIVSTDRIYKSIISNIKYVRRSALTTAFPLLLLLIGNIYGMLNVLRANLDRAVQKPSVKSVYEEVVRENTDFLNELLNSYVTFLLLGHYQCSAGIYAYI